MKLRKILGLVAFGLTSLSLAGSKKNKDCWQHKRCISTKWHKREGNYGILVVRGHPVWGTVSPKTFHALMSLDNAFRLFPHIRAGVSCDKVHLLQRSFGIMQATSMSLPYANESMIQAFNEYKLTMNREMHEATSILQAMVAKWIMNTQSSLRAQDAALYIYNSMQNSYSEDNGKNDELVVAAEHTRPDKRKFAVLPVHNDIFSSEPKAFEVSNRARVWNLLPTHYCSIISDIFDASNGPERSVEVIKDLSAVATYLEIANAFVKYKSGLNDYEIKLLQTMYMELQAALQRLVQKINLSPEKKGMYSAVITLGNKFELMRALMKNKSEISRQTPLSEG